MPTVSDTPRIRTTLSQDKASFIASGIGRLIDGADVGAVMLTNNSGADVPMPWPPLPREEVVHAAPCICPLLWRRAAADRPGHHRDPVEILEDHMGSGRQRDPDALGHDVAKRDPDVRVVLEAVHGRLPSLGPVSPRDGDHRIAPGLLMPGDALVEAPRAIPCRLSPEAEADLIQRAEGPLRPEEAPTSIKAGARVIVVDGVFAGHVGIARRSTNERVAVLMAMLGRSVVVRFDVAQVAALA